MIAVGDLDDGVVRVGLEAAVVRVEDGHSFFNLSLERILVLQHVHQLGVVDLKQHAGEFGGHAGEDGEAGLDEVQQLPPQLLSGLVRGVLPGVARGRDLHGLLSRREIKLS